MNTVEVFVTDKEDKEEVLIPHSVHKRAVVLSKGKSPKDRRTKAHKYLLNYATSGEKTRVVIKRLAEMYFDIEASIIGNGYASR